MAGLAGLVQLHFTSFEPTTPLGFAVLFTRVICNTDEVSKGGVRCWAGGGYRSCNQWRHKHESWQVAFLALREHCGFG